MQRHVSNLSLHVKYLIRTAMYSVLQASSPPVLRSELGEALCALCRVQFPGGYCALFRAVSFPRFEMPSADAAVVLAVTKESLSLSPALICMLPDHGTDEREIFPQERLRKIPLVTVATPAECVSDPALPNRK